MGVQACGAEVNSGGARVGFGLIWGLIGLVYSTVLKGTVSGAAIGKVIVEIRVVRRVDGSRRTFARAPAATNAGPAGHTRRHALHIADS